MFLTQELNIKKTKIYVLKVGLELRKPIAIVSNNR